MSNFLLFAIPNELWLERARKTPPDRDELLREQLCEARSLRRRISSGVNLESERRRFSTALCRIESELLDRLLAAEKNSLRASWDLESFRQAISKGIFPTISLDEGYLHLLVALEFARAEKRTPGISEPGDPFALGASLFEATQLSDHLSHSDGEVARVAQSLPETAVSASEKRKSFFDVARASKATGIVEVQLPFSNNGLIQPSIQRNPAPPVAVLPSSEEDEEDLDPAARRSRRQEMVKRLDKDVEAAIKQFRLDGRGGRVNASNQPHEVTIDVLGRWLRAEGEPARVRIVYADASEAAPFPLCCLRGREKPRTDPHIFRVALMSMRHLEIDRIVDFAWFRNREVSQTRSLAESDEFCFHYSLDQLRRLAEYAKSKDVAIRLEVYHTGFEPASLGFYRAVVAVVTGDESLQAGWARNRNLQLTVAPFYFRGGTTYEPSRDADGEVLEWY